MHLLDRRIESRQGTAQRFVNGIDRTVSFACGQIFPSVYGNFDHSGCRKVSRRGIVNRNSLCRRRFVNDHFQRNQLKEPLTPPAVNSSALDEAEEEYELPHMKYARSARPVEPVQEDVYYEEDAYQDEETYFEDSETEEAAYDDYSADNGEETLNWEEEQAYDDLPVYGEEAPAEEDEPEAAAAEPAKNPFRRSRRSRSRGANI